MRVVHIQKYGRSPILATCPLPVRAKGQYLIKMKHAPINPSDLNFYTGMYGIRKEGFPIMGFEGSGVIEQSDDPSLAGTRVSVLANMSNGTYAEYIVSNHNELILWPKSVSMADEELSMFSINPLSVMGLCNIVAERASSQIVLSAAASNVNKMMVQYLTKTYSDKCIIGLSRSNSLDDQLKGMGYDHLFRMEEFEGVKQALKHPNAVFLDCVGGHFAGNVFNVLPSDSMMVNYGRLSKENLGSVDLAELYFKNKFIRGFWLNTYLKSVSESQLAQAKAEIVQSHQIFKQKIRRVYPLEQFIEGTRESIKNQSEGKILLRLS